MFGKLTVSKRVAFGFGVVILLLIIMAVVGVSRLASMNASIEDIVSNKWAKVGSSS